MRNKKIEYNSKTDLDPKDQGPGSATIWWSCGFEGDSFSHQVEGQKAKFGSREVQQNISLPGQRHFFFSFFKVRNILDGKPCLGASGSLGRAVRKEETLGKGLGKELGVRCQRLFAAPRQSSA